MHWRRHLVPGSIAAAIALAAPAAAGAAVDTTLNFAAGSVRVQDPSPHSANEVRFTIPNSPTIRAFVDIRGVGEAHIAMGSPEALGVAHAVYTTQSLPGCQVYSGTTFGEADETVTAAGIEFDIRKDELAPNINVVLEDSAGGAANCAGFDGSTGRPVSFDASGAITGLEWAQPGDATALRAFSGPRAIVLAWSPPADALGVRYEIRELQPNGEFLPIGQASTTSTTINGLTPGVPHTYVVHAFRFWGGQWFSPNATGIAATVATELSSPPATGTVTPPVKPTVKGTAKKSAAKKAARAFALKGFRVRASRGRVRVTLPKLGKGQRIEIQRSTTAKKAKFARIATSKARTYTDRKVRRGRSYRYRLILVAKDGSRSLPSAALRVRVR
jgi:hypothetical protein